MNGSAVTMAAPPLSLSVGSLPGVRAFNRMQRLLLFLLFMVCVSRAEPPHPALDRVMPKIDLLDAYYEDTLEFLRFKGTEILRQNTHDKSAVLIFEYRFVPRPRGEIRYQKTEVPFETVLREVLAHFDLEYQIVGPDRIAIIDRKKKDDPK